MLSIVILNGCGGSGADSSEPIASPQIISSSPTVLQGIFVDSAVGGLAYTSSTQSGMTDSEGHFSYVAGEDVVFSIGDIKFPAVEGREVLSPLDVFNVSAINDERVSNLARLLQT